MLRILLWFAVLDSTLCSQQTLAATIPTYGNGGTAHELPPANQVSLVVAADGEPEQLFRTHQTDNMVESTVVNAAGQVTQEIHALTSPPITPREQAQPAALHSLEGEQQSQILPSGLIRHDRDRGQGSLLSKGKETAEQLHGHTVPSEAEDQLHSSSIRLVRKVPGNPGESERPVPIEQKADPSSTLMPRRSPLALALLGLSAVRSKLGEYTVGTLVMLMILSCLTGGSVTLLYFVVVGRMKPEEVTEAVRKSYHLSHSLVGLASDLGLMKKDYDFQINDGQAHWSTRYWKWCTPEEAETMGVSVQAAKKPYKGHERIEVDAKENYVHALMAKAGVELTKKEDMRELLWKLLRSDCYFMAAKENTSLLLMVETVRLRIVDSGRILIQDQDESLLQGRENLPCIEKPSNQSPVSASKALWDLMDMPDGMADFIQDSVEEIEFEGYGGLRCVERVHVMAVKLRTNDPNVVQVIGLPGHSEFTIDNPPTSGEGPTVTRKFRWLTLVQYLQIGGVLSNLTAEIRGKSLVEGPNRVQNLIDFLKNGGVDPDVWNSMPDRKIQLLLNELQSGKCVLEQNSRGLVRVVNIVSVRIWSPDQKYLLVDRGRRNEYGEESWEAQLPGRKKERSESLQEVAFAMCEIVRLRDDDLNFPDEISWEYYDYTEDSARFKGLITKYQKFFVDAVLEDDEELLQRMGLQPVDLPATPLLSDESFSG